MSIIGFPLPELATSCMTTREAAPSVAAFDGREPRPQSASPEIHSGLPR
jgi:hypothetical protein